MGVCDIPVISSVCDLAGEAAATLVAAPFEWLASAMGSAAGWIFEQVWTVMDSTTLVDVTNPRYQQAYGLTFGIGVIVMLVFFCFQLITGLVRRDPGALRRAVSGLAKSILGSFLVLALTGLALEATDQIAVGIVQATGQTMADMGARIALLAAGLGGITLAVPGAGAIIVIFLASLAITSALIVWFSLLIRKALILVCVVLAPFALSGLTWDITKGWFGKWASFVIALIVSKLVLVITLLVAVSQTASPLAPDLASVSEPIAGVVLMLIAGFAPYMTYKLTSFMGADMYHLMSAEQEAKHAVNRPLPLRVPAGKPANILPAQDTPQASTGSSPVPPPAPAPQPASGPANSGTATGGAGGAGTSSTPSPAASGGASGTASGGGSGATASGTAGASGGAAAAAGPAAAAVIAVQAGQVAAKAGPAAGAAAAGIAGHTAEAAQPPPPPAGGTGTTPGTGPNPQAPPTPPEPEPARVSPSLPPTSPPSPPPSPGAVEPPARPQPPAQAPAPAPAPPVGPVPALPGGPRQPSGPKREE
jgi:hypothetical protein